VRRAVIQGRAEEYLRYVYKSYEEVAALVRELGDEYQNVTRAQMMINLKGYNVFQHGCLQCNSLNSFKSVGDFIRFNQFIKLAGVPVLLRMIIVNMEHYPGYLDTLILINSKN
jgi:hypothetical protein